MHHLNDIIFITNDKKKTKYALTKEILTYCSVQLILKASIRDQLYIPYNSGQLTQLVE